MNKAYLLIGGNEGDRMSWLALAGRSLQEQAGEILSQSAIYETAPWGNPGQAAFLNQALCLLTSMNAEDLLHTILQIEMNMGRIRAEKNGPRNIDIDILFFNNDHIEKKGLVIPHPRIAERRFVLEPMNELAPDFVHPVLHKTMHTLLAECTDRLDVQKL